MSEEHECTAGMTKKAFDALWERAEAEKAKRASDMPTEKDAINVMFSAHQRLRELGWNDPVYCPKDGSSFDLIEAGSTGIHRGHYDGDWPTGSWWVEGDGDLYPSRPTLYRPTPAELERREKLRAAFRVEPGAQS